MAPFVASGLDFTNPRYYTGLVQSLKPPTNHIGDRYLPRRGMPGDQIEFEEMLFRSPIAPFVALATESPRLGEGATRHRWADAFYTRFKRSLDERDLRWLRLFGDAPDTTPQGGMAAAARRRLDKAATDLDEAIENRIEWLQINSLRGSLIKLADSYSSIEFAITYPVVTQTANALWSDATNGDPMTDIATWLQGIYWTASRVITSAKVIWNLQRSAKIRTDLFANTPSGSATRAAVGRNTILEMLRGEFGLEVEVYDAQYTTYTYDGTTPIETPTRFMPETEFLILPAGEIGTTWEAPAAQNNYATGKFTWIDEPGVNVKQDPWVTELGEGWYGVPVIQRPQTIIRATVIA